MSSNEKQRRNGKPKKKKLGPKPNKAEIKKGLQELLANSLGQLEGVTLKPWGHERILTKTDEYVSKEIFIKAGHRLSEQYHKKKTETMFLVSGNAWLQVGAEGFNMTQLMPVYIPAKTIHRLAAVGDCVILEVSSTELDDVVRTEDDYNR